MCKSKKVSWNHWTAPTKYEINSSGIEAEMYRITHASPPMGVENCNVGYTIKRVMNSIENIIAKKPNDTVLVFGPGFHFANWNPYIFAREIFQINREAREIKNKYPGVKMLFREEPWSLIAPNQNRLLSTWIQKKQNQIVKKLLNPSIVETVNTFDYVFTRWESMKFNDLHTHGIQDISILEMILNKI